MFQKILPGNSPLREAVVSLYLRMHRSPPIPVQDGGSGWVEAGLVLLHAAGVAILDIGDGLTVDGERGAAVAGTTDEIPFGPC